MRGGAKAKAGQAGQAGGAAAGPSGRSTGAHEDSKVCDTGGWHFVKITNACQRAPTPVTSRRVTASCVARLGVAGGTTWSRGRRHGRACVGRWVHATVVARP